jgi:hypothetical protein
VWRLVCLPALAITLGACFAPEPSAGAPCGPGDACPSGLTCVAGVCTTGRGSGSDSGTSGVCEQAPDGMACGDATASDCNAADTCVAEACVSNVAADGTACYDCPAGAAACASCAQGECRDASCQPDGPPVPATLTSPFSGTNGDEGNMFDVVAAQTLTITRFDTNTNVVGDTEYEIWTKPGTYVGFEGTASAWTLVGTASFATLGPGMYTPIPIPVDITIQAGQRQAFYLTHKSLNNRYHNGTQVGAVLVSTPELTLYEGAGVNYAMTGFAGINTPRAWEGRIHYHTGGGGTLATPLAGTDVADGIMFDVTPIRDLELQQLGVHLAAGTHDVAVYFRRGSYAGAETDAAAWQPLATATGVDSAGANVPTPLPVTLGVYLAAGMPTAFYVAASGAVATQPVTGGSTAAQNADLAIGQGAAITGVFGGAASAATPNVELGYGACQ